ERFCQAVRMERPNLFKFRRGELVPSGVSLFRIAAFAQTIPGGMDILFGTGADPLLCPPDADAQASATPAGTPAPAPRPAAPPPGSGYFRPGARVQTFAFGGQPR